MVNIWEGEGIIQGVMMSGEGEGYFTVTVSLVTLNNLDRFY